MKSAIFLASLLSAANGFEYNTLKPGKCPSKPGSIDGFVSTEFNYNILKGIWINVFDRKVLNEQYKCIHVDFGEVQEGNAKVPKNIHTFEYLQTAQSVYNSPVKE